MAHIGVSFSAPLFVLYVKRVLEIIFNRYWHQLGPNLAQFWSHGDHVWKYCWVLLGHLNLRPFRERILISFGPPGGTNKYWNTLSFVGEIEAARFCAIIVLETDLRQISVRFGPQNPTKICPKRAPKAIKKGKKKMLCVGSRTGRVLVDLDSPHRARNGPSESDFRGPARSRAHFKTKVPPRSHP